MNEILKDAPCLCKDDDMEIVPLRRNFFQKLCCYWFQNRDKQYDYPVLYSDGTISKAKCERIGGKPLGVIFKNNLITLKDSPYGIDWHEAMEYCQKIKIFGQSCKAGKIEFWKKYRKHKQVLNTLLESLGGEPLKSYSKYWSSSEYGSYYGAWYFCTGDGVGWGGEDGNLKDYSFSDFVVRPVLDLSKVSSKRKKLVASL
ncbi:MAG: hypothetical protein Q4F75_03935 [Pseudomonadota bacterium]|nr:hypothetical protein [Pseudomonadota bacterium]